jgi:hypothetical protein
MEAVRQEKAKWKLPASGKQNGSCLPGKSEMEAARQKNAEWAVMQLKSSKRMKLRNIGSGAVFISG